VWLYSLAAEGPAGALFPSCRRSAGIVAVRRPFFFCSYVFLVCLFLGKKIHFATQCMRGM
jgi:hypothetical protein